MGEQARGLSATEAESVNVMQTAAFSKSRPVRQRAQATLSLSRVVGLGTLTVLFMTACSRPIGSTYQGYVEGEYLYLSVPQAGYLKTLDTPRGSRVMKGQTLFVVASDPDDQSQAEAQARAGSVKEKLENLKEPRRPAEIAALEANLRANEATLRLARIQLEQQIALARKNFVSNSKVDEARSLRDQAKAQVEATKQQIAFYRVAVGRSGEVRGAAADLEAANAQVSQKRWLLGRKTVTAPAAGEIVDTYYQPGEWVPAAAPVASLLPDERRRLRFFVPETIVATVKPGDMVEASCDGCPTPIRARVDYVATQAEYTPPVIYSRGSREKLVFRIDALPTAEQAPLLRPGLPLDIRLPK